MAAFEAAGDCYFKMRSYEFAPYAIKTDDGNWTGSDHEYAQALMAHIDCQYMVAEAPWARGLDMLKVGKMDLMLEVSKNPKRAQYFHFVGPQRMETMVLATRKGKYPAITQWQQLHRLDAVLMRQKGSYYGEKFEQVLAQNPRLKSQFVELTNSEVRLILLQKGRIDGFLVDEIYLNYLLKTNKQAQQLIQKNPLVIHQSPVYFAFSKASVDNLMLERIQHGFKQLQATGKLEEITKKYSR